MIRVAKINHIVLLRSSLLVKQETRLGSSISSKMWGYCSDRTADVVVGQVSVAKRTFLKGPILIEKVVHEDRKYVVGRNRNICL